MKKLLIFLLITLFPVIILAKDYKVNEMNITLSVNDDFIVLTRDNLDNNDDLSKLNISKEAMVELMNSNNIYYDIIKKDLSYEILVIVPNRGLSFNNLNNASDTILNDLKNELVKQTGAKVSRVYKTNHNYVVVDYYDSNSNYYIVNYYTVVNAKGYNFQLQKKSLITDQEKNELKQIVDSVKIDVLDEYKDESKENQDKIDNYGKNSGFDYMQIVYGALIGAAAGLISYIIILLIRKKKSS